MNHFNSTINRKNCKCSDPNCKLMPDIGCQGYNFKHLPEELKNALLIRRGKVIAARNARKSAISRKLHKAAKDTSDKRSGQESPVITPQWVWFLERRQEMTNICIECGRRTNRNDDKFFTWSVCHIVPKSLVKSQALNPLNWVELCYLHHQEFDSTFEKAAKMMCFGEIKMKFQLFKNLIPPEELRKVNPHLLT